MKYQTTIPETIVAVETKNGKLPQGAGISIFVPFKESIPIEEEPVTKPLPEPVPQDSLDGIPEPTFERIYENVEFRNNRFEILGKAPDLGLDDSNWTILLEVRFIDFSKHCRIIGSATSKAEAGSSLQIGTLKDGWLWIDTFKGAATGPQVELNRWYQLAITHNRAGEEVIYLDGQAVSRGRVPVFKSQADIYIGRWINTYAEFDLKRIAIYPLLSDEEI